MNIFGPLKAHWGRLFTSVGLVVFFSGYGITPCLAEVSLPSSSNVRASFDVRNGSLTQEPVPQCAELLKGCLNGHDPDDRSNCFFSSSKHPFCEGTLLGKIAAIRWSSSSTFQRLKTGVERSDTPCVTHFDEIFQSQLTGDEPLSSRLPDLLSNIQKCK